MAKGGAGGTSCRNPSRSRHVQVSRSCPDGSVRRSGSPSRVTSSHEGSLPSGPTREIRLRNRIVGRARPLRQSEGPERKRLEALLTPGASLAGRLSLKERDRMMARATALVHPSYVEGWGLVVMEAAAQGTPSIGFDVPGVRDSIVDGSTGWLCDDIDHFVKTWISSAHEPLMQTDAADRARARAFHFGVERTVDAFEVAAFEAVALHEAKSAKGALINIRS